MSPKKRVPKGEGETRTTFRLPDDVLDAVQEVAEQEGRSLNSQVGVALRWFLRALKAAGQASGEASLGITPTPPPPKRKRTKKESGE